MATLDQELSSSSSSFLSDDLLLEILVRLPQARSAAKCRLVCKSWSSLIFSDEFRTRFNQNNRHHHSLYLDPSYSLPCTLLFRFYLHKIDDMTLTFHAPSSNARPGKFHHYPKSATYLDFLPQEWPRSRIEITSGDLVLSSINWPPKKYCVSNPLTRQWNILPQVMPPLTSGGVSGLWLDPNHYGSDRRLGNYRVVILDYDVASFVVSGDDYMFRALMFYSETGEWSERYFTSPMASAPAERRKFVIYNAVESKGVLYFPFKAGDFEPMLRGFVALDPIGSSECRFIKVPDGFGEGWRGEVSLPVCVCVVRGRLRLWQYLDDNDLKVWELCDDTTWVLAHNVRVKRGTTSVIALDPNDGDVVYVVNNSWIWKCKIREYNKKVCQLPNYANHNCPLWRLLSVHSIEHTSSRVLPM